MFGKTFDSLVLLAGTEIAIWYVSHRNAATLFNFEAIAVYPVVRWRTVLHPA